MRKLLLIGLLAAGSCDSFLRSNPDYCVDDSSCSSGTICNSSLHRCEPGTVGPVVLTSINPNVAALAGGDTVVVTGMNFRTGATVTFNGVAATQVTVKSATELSVVVPKVDGSCGPATVAVTNPGAAAVASDALFRFKIGMPAFTSIPGGLPSFPIAGHAIKAVDFDVDGKMDLGVLDTASQNVLIYKGNGSKDLNFSLVGTGHHLGALVVDMLFVKANGDNYPDLIAWNSIGLGLYLNNQDKDFTDATMISDTIGSVAVGTLNGTTNAQDLLIGDTASARVTYRLAVPPGAGAPYSGAASPLALGEKTSAVLVDSFENGSPYQAIVAAQPNTSRASVYFGQATGVFTQKYVDLGTQPIQMAAADLDKDGNKDLVAVGGLGSTASLSAVYGDGNRGFTSPPVVTSISSSPQLVMTGDSGFDFDCDGRPDVVVYLVDSTSILIYLNNVGGRMLGAPVSIPVGSAIDSLAVADLDGDGQPDLALVTRSAVMPNRSSVLLRNTSH